MTHFGVVGAGLMGHGIAVALAGNHTVAIYDPSPDVMAALDQRIEGAAERMQLSPAESRDLAGCIRSAPTLTDVLSDVDIAVESVPERLEIKHQVIAEIEATVGAAVPIWTNTSVLPLTDIAAEMVRPSRLVGVHWWNPPYVIPLVEVAPSEATDRALVRDAAELLTQLGKETVVLDRDIPGFVGNRLQFALVREALHLVDAGICSPEVIDQVVRSSIALRWPGVGPMENADYIGLDLTRDILRSLSPTLSSETSSFAALDSALEHNDRGRSTGRGLSEWPEGRAEEVVQRLQSSIDRNSSQDRE